MSDKANMRANMRLMKDMTEPELRLYFNALAEMIGGLTPPDVVGFMLIMHTDQQISQYVSSIHPETAPAALRELADRLERRETVTR